MSIKALNIRTSYLAAIIALALWSCVKLSLYEKNIAVDPDGWSLSDSIEFVVEIEDTLSPMNFLLNLRHNTDYEYSNIYFFVNTVYPGNDYSRDTIEILLAGKDGKWFGKGFGELKEVQVMLKNRVVFPRAGTYRFSFVHAMREDPLVGIEDVGIRIEKYEGE